MLRTKNENWGFYGTARQDGGESFAEEAWMAAFEHVSKWMNWGEEMTRAFLDSRNGRHYADAMHGRTDWREALTREWSLEESCRAFFEEADPAGYKKWRNMNGDTPAERTLIYSGINRDEMRTAVNYLLGVDYSQAQIDACIEKAGPLAQALAMIILDIPEEIREIYLNGGIPADDGGEEMSPG